MKLSLRLVMCFILMTTVYGCFDEYGKDMKSKRQEKIKKRREEARKVKLPAIIKFVEKMIAEKQYSRAVNKASYSPFHDNKLEELKNFASEKLKKQQNRAIEKRLLNALKKVPVDNLVEKIAGYSSLAEINPKVLNYSQKRDFYKKKLEAKEKKKERTRSREVAKRQKRVAKWGAKPQASQSGRVAGGNNSYLAVDRYLALTANDPDSIKIEGCSDVSYNNIGWLVACNYRGRNVFGGMVRNGNWFAIRFDKVVKVYPADAYKFK